MTRETCPDCGSDMRLECTGLETYFRQGDNGQCRIACQPEDHHPQGRSWKNKVISDMYVVLKNFVFLEDGMEPCTKDEVVKDAREIIIAFEKVEQ